MAVYFLFFFFFTFTRAATLPLSAQYSEGNNRQQSEPGVEEVIVSDCNLL